MKYLVTGGTGFIGSRLVEQLLAAGHSVRLLVRDRGRAARFQRAGATLFIGDVTEPETLQAPVEGVDGVFHLAAWYRIGARHKKTAEQVNVHGTRNVLEAMRAAGVPKGVYTSTVAVFGNTEGKLVDENYRRDGPWVAAYHRTKWRAHYEVAEPMMRAGLPLVVVMPGVTYGPGDPSAIGLTLRQYLQRRLPLLPGGAAYCWAHVDDVARGHILAMERGRAGENYILAGVAATLIEVIAIAERLTGIPAPRLHAPPGLLRALSALVGVVETLIPLPEEYSSETLRVAAGNTYLATSAKAERELGFCTRPLEEGLRQTLTAELESLKR